MAQTIFLKKMDETKESGAALDVKSIAKELSFNIGGHMLHTTFWENMGPAGKGGGGEHGGAVADLISKEYGNFEKFKKMFSINAASTEGSGWAALAVHQCVDCVLIMQIEKHNVNVFPNFTIIMALDVWEHAHYIDYKNDRAKFVENFWNIVNWDQVNRNLAMVK